MRNLQSIYSTQSCLSSIYFKKCLSPFTNLNVEDLEEKHDFALSLRSDGFPQKVLGTLLNEKCGVVKALKMGTLH